MATRKPILAILDDELEMRKALRRLLTGRGFEVQEFADGNAFFVTVASRPFDCLLLDLHMTDISGFDVLENLQSRRLGLPVVVITAHDEPGTAQRAFSLGAYAYLKKPVDCNTLLSNIEETIKQCKRPDENQFQRRDFLNKS